MPAGQAFADDVTLAPARLAYAQLRFYRRNGFVSVMLLSSVFFTVLGWHLGVDRSFVVAPLVAALSHSLAVVLLLSVCVCTLTGPIHFNRVGRDGTLKSWHWFNKVVAVTLMTPWVAFLILGLSAHIGPCIPLLGITDTDPRLTDQGEWEAWTTSLQAVALADQTILNECKATVETGQLERLSPAGAARFIRQHAIEPYQTRVIDELDQLTANCPAERRKFNDAFVDYARKQIQCLALWADMAAGQPKENELQAAIAERDQALQRFTEESERIGRERN